MTEWPAEEHFDVCDSNGRLTGALKARSLVHRDGDWHRAFHCWIVVPSPRGAPSLILQLRSAAKDTWPGRWDVSVGGHYSAGEGVEGGLREIHEELGLHVTLEQLRHAGWHREEVFHENGLIDREIQDVYFLIAEIDLAALAPAAEEVSAVALVPLSELRSLLDGRSTPVPAPSVFAGGELTRLLLNRADLVPRRDGYYERVVRFAQRLPNTEPLRRRWW